MNSSGTLDWDEWKAKTGVAITPQFSMQRVNEPLLLYRGPITLELDNGIKIPDATVTWEWYREPIILVSFEPSEAQLLKGDATAIFNKPHKVTFDSLGAATWFSMHEFFSCGEVHHQKLKLLRPVVTGPIGPAQMAMVHLVNCHDLSEDPVHTIDGGGAWHARLSLSSTEWKILVDKVPHHDNLVREMNKFGGQAITHVVQVSRHDSSDFDLDSLNKVLSHVRDFIAFASGSKPQMCLASGYSRDGRQVWQAWEACASSHWSPRTTWTPDIGGQVSPAFSGYHTKLQDPDWSEVISLACDWYVKAKHRGLEAALVLGQAALEMLASNTFELTTVKPCTEQEWESKKWPAASRIRWLLKLYGVMDQIPPKLEKLIAYRFPNDTAFADGPHALTELRNAIAHPKKKKRERFGPDVNELRYEAAKMVLFFLEHVLLRLIEFDGIATAEATHGYLINYGPPIGT
ncbi:MAG: hypothetical protein ACKVT0_00125 [Planctomycetaceae bacterium]